VLGARNEANDGLAGGSGQREANIDNGGGGSFLRGGLGGVLGARNEAYDCRAGGTGGGGYGRGARRHEDALPAYLLDEPVDGMRRSSGGRDSHGARTHDRFDQHHGYGNNHGAGGLHEVRRSDGARGYGSPGNCGSEMGGFGMRRGDDRAMHHQYRGYHQGGGGYHQGGGGGYDDMRRSDRMSGGNGPPGSSNRNSYYHDDYGMRANDRAMHDYYRDDGRGFNRGGHQGMRGTEGMPGSGRRCEFSCDCSRCLHALRGGAISVTTVDTMHGWKRREHH
jgi:hypothetical protein